MQLGPPQPFVGVDVADAGDQALIQQRAFESGLPPAKRRVESLLIELVVEDVARDMRDLGRQVGATW